MITLTERDRTIAALTIYGEARSESRLGKAAVAWVLLHRANNPRWWGGPDLASVCLMRSGQYGQFSCWNPGDPNCSTLLALLDGGDTGRAVLSDDARINPLLTGCFAVLDDVLAGRIPDPTHGATHYHADYIARPAWARGHTPTATIGRHLFYADIEPGVVPWRPELPIPEPHARLPVDEPVPETGLLVRVLDFLWRIFR